MTKQELVKLLVSVFKNEKGILDLSELDFSNEDLIGVDISRMKVKGNIYQRDHKVGGNLYQDSQKVEGTLYQMDQKVVETLYQDRQIVKGGLFQ